MYTCGWFISMYYRNQYNIVKQISSSKIYFRKVYWSGLPFPSPGDLLNPGIEPVSLMSPALTGGFFTTELPGRPINNIYMLCYFAIVIRSGMLWNSLNVLCALTKLNSHCNYNRIIVPILQMRKSRFRMINTLPVCSFAFDSLRLHGL